MKTQTLLIVALLLCFIISPTQSLLQVSKSIRSYGGISYSAGLLYGVCSHPWVLNERDFQEMKKLGVEYVRMGFIWEEFGKYYPLNFSKYDQFVEWAKANDLKIIALFTQVPPWLRSDSSGPFTIPTGTDFDDFVTQFGEFVYAVVNHYKGNITHFEVWNEANINVFWNDTEGRLERETYNREMAITKYVILLKEAYTRAKAANPNCKIISTGLSECDYDYVQGMYDNGVKGYFDYLGLHPDFWHSPTKNYDPDYVDWDSSLYGQFPKIELVRNVMVANGDEGKDIFATELGIGGADGPEGPTTEEMQAERLRRVFEKIDHDPGYLFIDTVCWYQWRDWGSETQKRKGLLREDYTPRPMYYAYKDIIASH